MLYKIPHDLGPWHGVDMEFSSATYEILRGAGLLVREYTNEYTGERISFSVINSPELEHFHNPIYCFGGSGFVQMGERTQDLEFPEYGVTVHGGYLHVRSEDGAEIVLYAWYTPDGKNTWPYALPFKIDLLKRQLLEGKRYSAYMIRLQTYPIPDLDSAEERLAEFARHLVPYLVDEEK